MLKKILAASMLAVTAAVTAAVVLWPGASAAEQTSERLTSYIPSSGAEMAAPQAQALAVGMARVAGASGALEAASVHTTFAAAHALLMGTSAHGEEGGPGERGEEMRSDVWVTSMTAPAGQSFTPIAPVPRGRSAPKGSAMVVVTDARTGFVKEEMIAPSAPSVAVLGTPVTASFAAEPLSARSARRAHASVAPGGDRGSVHGRLLPARVGVKVSLGRPHGAPVASGLTRAARPGTSAGSFWLRAPAGRYVLSAPGCGRREVQVLVHQSTAATLRCAPPRRP